MPEEKMILRFKDGTELTLPDVVYRYQKPDKITSFKVQKGQEYVDCQLTDEKGPNGEAILLESRRYKAVGETTLSTSAVVLKVVGVLPASVTNAPGANPCAVVVVTVTTWPARLIEAMAVPTIVPATPLIETKEPGTSPFAVVVVIVAIPG